MRYWLITANPIRQGLPPISHTEDLISYFDIISGWDSWSVKSGQISKGDGFFLMLLGQKDMNGLIARGTFTSDSYKENIKSRFNPQGLTLFADIEFMMPPRHLSLGELKERFPDQHWTPQSSGISIKSKYVNDLCEFYSMKGVEYIWSKR